MNYYDFTKICALITAIIHQVGHVPGREPLTAFVNSVFYTDFRPVSLEDARKYEKTGYAIMENDEAIIFSRQVQGKLKALYVYKRELNY